VTKIKKMNEIRKNGTIIKNKNSPSWIIENQFERKKHL